MWLHKTEIWALSQKDIKIFKIFEHQILRKVYGPIQIDSNIWRIKTNREIKVIIKYKDNKIY